MSHPAEAGPPAGRLAVVTGAASGIGRATTRLLLERGCRVVAADIDAAGLRTLRELGPAVRDVPVDVSNWTDVQAFGVDVLARDGVPDYLVCAAGINPLAESSAAIGEAGEVAEAIVYLLSDAASFVTGATLPIDGGLTAI